MKNITFQPIKIETGVPVKTNTIQPTLSIATPTQIVIDSFY